MDPQMHDRKFRRMSSEMGIMKWPWLICRTCFWIIMGPEAVQIRLHFLQHNADVFFAPINASTTNYCKLQGYFHFCHFSAMQVHVVFLGGPNIATADKKRS